ncbi:MAG: hypothetical protein ACRD68_01630 [Pyrinomonadaceae bacterium]
MNRREFLGELGLLAVGGGLGIVVRDFIFDRDADRRFALYNIMRELQKGMPAGEVETIIGRHDAPFIEKHRRDNSISLFVSMGAINALYLVMEFSGGRLQKARFSGEDNPWDVPKDAPPNVE